MKVLITAPSLDVNKNVSGISSVVRTIIANDPATQYFHFISGQDDKQAGMISRFLEIFISYFKLIGIVIKNKIDLLHLNLALNPKSIIRDFGSFFIVRYLLFKPVVVHLHGGKYLIDETGGLLKKLITIILNNAKSVIVLSDLEKDIISARYKLPGVIALKNTIDDAYIEHKRLNDPQKKQILFLGRYHESKGIEVLLKAIDIFQNKNYSNIEFVFYGKGPLEQQIINKANAYPKMVKLGGVISGTAKLEALAAVDIFILPSLYGEGLPMALLEAMAAGAVPVVTKDGSMGQVVNDQVTGCFIEKNNTEDLVQKLDYLLQDTEKLSRFSAACRDFIRNNFSIKEYIGRLHVIYNNAL